MTSLHVICGLGLSNQKFWLRQQIGDCLKNFIKDLFFFWRTLAAVSLVLGLGLEHSCPWPREGLSSERLSLALASDFFCVLSLGLEPCVPDSTSALQAKFFALPLPGVTWSKYLDSGSRTILTVCALPESFADEVYHLFRSLESRFCPFENQNRELALIVMPALSHCSEGLFFLRNGHA